MLETSPPLKQSSKLHHIARVEVDGRLGWRKEVESMGLSLRLRKGNPAKSFAKEQAIYLACQGRGLPLPEILDVGDGYFVTADAGFSLARLRKITLECPETFEQALVDAAGALARLHREGFYHGRPALKDICWDNGRITFIDLENAGQGAATDQRFARDVLIFIFSIISETRGAGPEVSEAAKAYRAEDTKGIWDQAVARAVRLNRYQWLLGPLSEMLKNKREFQAIRPFLKFMTD